MLRIRASLDDRKHRRRLLASARAIRVGRIIGVISGGSGTKADASSRTALKKVPELSLIHISRKTSDEVRYRRSTWMAVTVRRSDQYA